MPAEITCEHCGASVVVPRDADAAGVTCTYCAQWITLRAAPRVELAPIAATSRRASPLTLVAVGLVGLVAAVWFLRRSSSSSRPVSVASATPESAVAPPPSASAAPARSYFRLLETFGAHGGLAGQFLGAAGLAIDGAGNVWVADSKSPRVQKLDPHGKLLFLVNRDEPDLPNVAGLAADASGHVFVALDGGTTLIVVLAGDDGRVLAKIKPPTGARWGPIAVDQAGSLYALTNEANGQSSVVKMDATGKALTRYEKTNDHAMGRPAIDGDGHLYVPHGFESKIYVHDAKGAIVNRWGTTGEGEGDLDLGVYRLAWDFHGHVLVASRTVQAFDAGGRFLTRIASAATSAPVFDLALAPDGTLYVLAGDDTIRRYALDPDALAK